MPKTITRDRFELNTNLTEFEGFLHLIHERQERQHCQALLERVLHEIELRAEVIMDEPHIVRWWRLIIGWRRRFVSTLKIKMHLIMPARK
jgi:hypothetical protein